MALWAEVPRPPSQAPTAPGPSPQNGYEAAAQPLSAAEHTNQLLALVVQGRGFGAHGGMLRLKGGQERLGMVNIRQNLRPIAKDEWRVHLA